MAVRDDAGRRRLKFIGQVAVSGLRWGKELADHVLLLLGALLLGAGIGVGGVLLHRPAWFLGVFAGVLVLLVLGEGAYRTWDEAAKRASDAESGLREDSSRQATAIRLAAYAREGRGIEQELPSVQASPAEWNEARRTMASILDHWVASAESEIRRNAPDLMPRWRDEFETRFPDGSAWASSANIRELLRGTIGRLDELIEQLTTEGKAQ